MQIVETRVQIPDAFSELFEPHRYKVYYGGRGKGSSWSFARALLILVSHRGLRVLCAREYQASIGDSVHRLLEDQIGMLGLESIFNITRAEITCSNGGIFIFKGIRNNPGEIKSLEGIDIAWLTEAERTTNESLDVLIPTIRKAASEIWIDFNTDDEAAPTYQRFIANPPPDAFVRFVTYRDNPFFPDTLKAEMEYVRRVDPDKYQWIWEGKPRRISQALVFSGKYRVEEFEHGADDIERYYLGVDWGFSADPTTMVRSYVHDGSLYIDHEAYGVGVELDELSQLFDSVPEGDKWPCQADDARPETISYLRRNGYENIRKVKKPKGSVEDGISILKAFETIVIHPRCRHTIAEFGSYSYKVDRMTGDVLPILVDKDNHCLAEGTLVETVRGPKPIEGVRFGDMLLTRAGYRMCTAAWRVNQRAEVYRVADSTGKELVGTGNHRVWTQRGFVSIDTLRYGDVILTARSVWQNQKWLSLRERFIADGRTRNRGQTESISIVDQPAYDCTSPSGRASTAAFQPSATSTMLTATRSIMKSQISCASQRPVTQSYIPTMMSGERGGFGTSPKLEAKLLSGIGRKKEELGIANMAGRRSRNVSLSRSGAPNVANLTKTSPAGHRRGSAPALASPHGEERRAPTLLSESARDVLGGSCEANTPRPSIALSYVVSVRPLKRRRPVYDLSVDAEHEFFANGILVHNCVDALRYSHYRRAKREIVAA